MRPTRAVRGPLAGWRFPQQKARTFTHLLKLLEAEGVDDIGVGRGHIFKDCYRCSKGSESLISWPLLEVQTKHSLRCLGKLGAASCDVGTLGGSGSDPQRNWARQPPSQPLTSVTTGTTAFRHVASQHRSLQEDLPG